MRFYFRIEEGVAKGLANLSALLLATLVTLFVLEIFMRYAVGSPTKWSNDAVGFVMTAMIFLALPEVTRRGQHIAITFIIELLGERAARVWSRIIALISSLVSFGLFWIVSTTIIKQFNGGILTNTVIQIPKWILLTPIASGFIFVAIIFLTTALGATRSHDLG